MPCYLPTMLVDQLYPRIHPSPHAQLISTIFVLHPTWIRSSHHGSLVASSRPTKCIPLVEANALAELDVLSMRLASRPPTKNLSAPALQALGIFIPISRPIRRCPPLELPDAIHPGHFTRSSSCRPQSDYTILDRQLKAWEASRDGLMIARMKENLTNGPHGLFTSSTPAIVVVRYFSSVASCCLGPSW